MSQVIHNVIDMPGRSLEQLARSWEPVPTPPRSEAEWSWAAGVFEGEGCIHRNERADPTKGKLIRMMTMTMTDEDIVRRFHEIVQVGSVREIKPQQVGYKQPWRWQVNAWPAMLMLAEQFYPWLGDRRRAKLIEVLQDPPRHPNALRVVNCPAGHPYEGDGSDVRVTTTFGLQRVCRICAREQRRVPDNERCRGLPFCIRCGSEDWYYPPSGNRQCRQCNRDRYHAKVAES